MEMMAADRHVEDGMVSDGGQKNAGMPHAIGASFSHYDVLNRAVEMGAEEIIFSPGTHVVMTGPDGRCEVLEGTLPSHEDTLRLAFNIMNGNQRDYFKKKNSITFRYPFKACVFRVNLFIASGTIVAQFHRIRNDAAAPGQFPEALRTALDCTTNRILICYGDAGCDRLFRSVIEYYNEGGHEKIAVLTRSSTLQIRPKKAQVFVLRHGTDIEFNQDTFSFLTNMQPDVLCLDEIIGFYPLEAAISLCAQSRMTILKVYASGAAEAIRRISQEFPMHIMRGLRTSLVSNLCAMVGQRTVMTGSGQKGYINEVLVNNDEFRAVFEESSIFEEPKAGTLKRLMETGKDGMMSFDQSIEGLVESGSITAWEGYRRYSDREKFMKKFMVVKTLPD